MHCLAKVSPRIADCTIKIKVYVRAQNKLLRNRVGYKQFFLIKPSVRFITTLKFPKNPRGHLLAVL